MGVGVLICWYILCWFLKLQCFLFSTYISNFSLSSAHPTTITAGALRRDRYGGVFDPFVRSLGGADLKRVEGEDPIGLGQSGVDSAVSTH
mmetsp:Transcript_17683/g.35257  ORF Transcript_17683/g.35257 Transcript_17683/m.35257 type:complete len:90 (-) Transcript_17683:453-722(-)